MQSLRQQPSAVNDNEEDLTHGKIDVAAQGTSEGRNELKTLRQKLFVVGEELAAVTVAEDAKRAQDESNGTAVHEEEGQHSFRRRVAGGRNAVVAEETPAPDKPISCINGTGLLSRERLGARLDGLSATLDEEEIGTQVRAYGLG